MHYTSRGTWVRCWGVLILGLLPLSVRADELPFNLPVPIAVADGYSDEIPRPEEVIGHRIGTTHTEPHQLLEYFRAVEEKSNRSPQARMTLHEYARSHENRPLFHAVVTSRANHRRLERIVEANRRLSDAPEAVSDEDLEDLPVVVYHGYGVHGDEASGPEAAVLLLYHLLAGEGEAIKEMLDRLVILIDPNLNPDGRQRFTTWVNQNRGATPVTDPNDREHRQPWPGGRTNHYWFDLNRDLLPVRHPETRGRVQLFNHWRPQVVTDFHEMGSEAHYFFQPGVPTRVNRNIPPANQELTGRMAEYHAAALDGIGSLYYTRGTFDDFNPGKGSTYPDVTGAIGILFEQGSSRALERETEHGLLTYEFTIRNQFSTSLSTLQAAVAMRTDLLKYQRDFYRDAPALARDSRVNAYLIDLRSRRTQAQELVRLLLEHRIEVHALAEPVTVDGRRFHPGQAVVVPVDQPQIRLLTTMMERQTNFDDVLFYDVSTWSLPLAFGVRWAETDTRPPLGEAITEMPLDGGRRIGGEAEYAYLIPWNDYFAPRALYRLQSAGARVRLITQPFSTEVDGRTRRFPRGTLMVTVRQREPVSPLERIASPDEIHETVQRIVDEDHLRVFAVDSGLVADGPDLGSRRDVQLLQRPEIALLTGSGTRAYSVGETWHLLSQRFRIPVSLVDVENVRTSVLERYNTLILADGSYGRLSAETVRDWIRSGGKLIALGSGADWAVSNKLVDLETRPFDLNALIENRPFAELSDARGEHGIGGSIFEITLDRTHPLTFGHGRKVPVFRNHTRFYEPSGSVGVNVATYSNEPLVSGYISKERLAQIPGAAALVATRQGSGRIVLIMDNPNFRAFWYGTNGLFLNAVFFGF